MTLAQALVNVMKPLAKSPQFNHSKARAAARKDGHVDWDATKKRNDDFNPEVDGCETFVMTDGSVCEWSTPTSTYNAKAK